MNVGVGTPSGHAGPLLYRLLPGAVATQRLEDPHTLTAWISRITTNSCLDALTCSTAARRLPTPGVSEHALPVIATSSA